MQTLIARLLGRADVDSIDSMHMSFGADWAHNGPAWLLFGCLALAFGSAFFYLRYQPRASRRMRIALGFLRGVLLCLLLLILADPILEVVFTSHPRPVLWVLFDGTDSMNLRDRLTSEDVERLSKVADLSGDDDAAEDKEGQAAEAGSESSADPLATDGAANESTDASADSESAADTMISRAGLVRGWLAQDGGKLLDELDDRFRVELFQFRRGDNVAVLNRSADATDTTALDPKHVASQYQPDGPVTSLSAALDDLRRRHASSNLTGVVMLSDFDHNSGPAPLASARRLGVPVFTVGVGATHAVDVSVDLQAALTMKKTETSTLSVTVRQQELDGTPVIVRVTAHSIESGSDITSSQAIPVGERTVTLAGPSTFLEFAFTPEEAGRFVFAAEVDPLPGEVVSQNNRAEREVTVIDDFLRLLFVEYEPTWEWRFVKEVFHRDKLVGMRGFRTYLRSSDPVVRETNELFLPTLTLPRNEFFEHDVIFLGDMPSSSLNTRFAEMVKEFVGKFGGGLVVMAGPRFGPGQLSGTPIADMLPVIVDPDGQMRDDRETRLRLTPLANQFDFMRLGQNDQENAQAWGNLGQLPWYQPVRRVELSSTSVLAEHPTHVCADGRTPQPLIAVRRYGRGEVIYIAFNEMWRLRRKYGELYYRQFWGQLIHRLGLSHALGSQKRFVARTDRQQYQPDDTVIVTVEAYDENFEPLTSDVLDDRHLTAEMWLPGRGTTALSQTRSVTLTEYRPGIFETRIPVQDAGDYVLKINDPVSLEPVDVFFQVDDLSIEHRSATRNTALQDNIAAETGGRSSELDGLRQSLASFDPPRLVESTVEVLPLWSTWLTFVVVIGLLFVEWILRKLSNLT